jgi:hypothetical protein
MLSKSNSPLDLQIALDGIYIVNYEVGYEWFRFPSWRLQSLLECNQRS